MNRNNLWKFVFVLVVIFWSFYEMYPPTGRNLAVEFQEKAVRKDVAFTNIVTLLEKLQRERPERPFANLVEAVGTNSITNYFPFYEEVRNRVESQPGRTPIICSGTRRARVRLGLDHCRVALPFWLGWIPITWPGTPARSFHQRDASRRFRRPSRCCGVAWTSLGWRNRSSSRRSIARSDFDPIARSCPKRTRDQTKRWSAIQKAAFLEFKLVHENSDALIQQGLREPGYELLKKKELLPDGESRITAVLVKKKAELTGDYIKSAFVTRDAVGQPEINFTLNSKGAEIFGRVTAENVQRRLAIVLDGHLESAPVIKGPIEGGSGQITGSFTDKEAHELANALENPLQAPVSILSESSVDPTLGSDTVRSGFRSAVIGTVAVAAFMVIYYIFAGAVADVALISNIIILLGVMCSVGTTLTLPGIAGVVLTIGMAVDANVLIFERIREESAKGKSLRGALAAGYDRAFGTIFDSHVTTLISSVILIFMGTGPIKGFGVTLTIGVAASLFTALVVTRLIFDFLLAKGWLTTLPMLHIIRASKLDFMKLAKPAFILSWTIILIGLGYGVFVRGNKMFGTDFAGGDNLTLNFTQKVEGQKLREALTKEAGVIDPVINTNGTSPPVWRRCPSDRNTERRIRSSRFWSRIFQLRASNGCNRKKWARSSARKSGKPPLWPAWCH